MFERRTLLALVVGSVALLSVVAAAGGLTGGQTATQPVTVSTPTETPETHRAQSGPRARRFRAR